MSEKPQSVAIGAFIVGSLLILISALLFISGSGLGRDRERVVMVFNGSVKGLSIGAPIALRGVQIGQVTDIDLIFDTDSIDLIMVVEADIQEDNIQRRGSETGNYTEEMISRGLRAQLNSQSLLTGLLYIQLDFHPGSELILADLDTPHIQIPTIPTDLERIGQQMEAMDFGQLADDIQVMTDGLARFIASESFQQLPTRINAALEKTDQLIARIDQQMASSGPRLDALLDNTSTAVATINRELPSLASASRDSLAQLDSATLAFEKTMLEARGLVADDSPTAYRLNQALRELALAGKALQSLAKTLDEQPESLIRGRKSGE